VQFAYKQRRPVSVYLNTEDRWHHRQKHMETTDQYVWYQRALLYSKLCEGKSMYSILEIAALLMFIQSKMHTISLLELLQREAVSSLDAPLVLRPSVCLVLACNHDRNN
jgi:hypothetical protein